MAKQAKKAKQKANRRRAPGAAPGTQFEVAEQLGQPSAGRHDTATDLGQQQANQQSFQQARQKHMQRQRKPDKHV